MKRTCHACHIPHSGSGDYCQAHARWTFAGNQADGYHLLDERQRVIARLVRGRHERLHARLITAAVNLAERLRRGGDYGTV